MNPKLMNSIPNEVRNIHITTFLTCKNVCEFPLLQISLLFAFCLSTTITTQQVKWLHHESRLLCQSFHFF